MIDNARRARGSTCTTGPGTRKPATGVPVCAFTSSSRSRSPVAHQSSQEFDAPAMRPQEDERRQMVPSDRRWRRSDGRRDHAGGSPWPPTFLPPRTAHAPASVEAIAVIAGASVRAESFARCTSRVASPPSRPDPTITASPSLNTTGWPLVRTRRVDPDSGSKIPTVGASQLAITIRPADGTSCFVYRTSRLSHSRCTSRLKRSSSNNRESVAAQTEPLATVTAPTPWCRVRRAASCSPVRTCRRNKDDDGYGTCHPSET